MPRPSRRTELLEQLVRVGGIADGASLVKASSEATLRAAVAQGVVARIRHGRYALAETIDPRLGDRTLARSWADWDEGTTLEETAALQVRHGIALACGGVLSHRCAAAHHGWPLLREPDPLEIALPPGYRQATALGVSIVVRRRRLTRDERTSGVRAPMATVLDCARDLPFVEALAVADAALRSGEVGSIGLRSAAATLGGPGSASARRVARFADGRAANPFESALRGVLLDVRELTLEPQHEIGDGLDARVDLADRALRIVAEADSYEFHGTPEAFAKGMARYAELAGRDWLILPFTLRKVLDDPGWVRDMGRAAAYGRLQRGYGSGTTG